VYNSTGERMHYVLLCYGGAWQNGAQSDAECGALEEARRTSDDALRVSGYLLALEEFEPCRTAMTVRVQDGTTDVRIGHATGAAEHVREVFIITARDLNEAIQVAASMPQARVGAIEIRPLVLVS